LLDVARKIASLAALSVASIQVDFIRFDIGCPRKAVYNWGKGYAQYI